MFHDRRSLRRWAARVLLVWLFGVATGIAHACALRLANQHGDAVKVSVASRVAEVHHGHGNLSPDGDDQANCRDFCEKSSLTAPSLKLEHDQDGDLQPIAMPWSPSIRMAARSAASPARPDGVIHQRGGPPLRISFQRLAL